MKQNSDKKEPKGLRIKNFQGYSFNEYMYNLINGIYSGYPLCCIEYFCTLMKEGVHPALYNHWKYTETITNKIQYVQCPKCIKAKNYVKQSKIREGIPSTRQFNRIYKLTFSMFEAEAKAIIQQILVIRKKR